MSNHHTTRDTTNTAGGGDAMTELHAGGRAGPAGDQGEASTSTRVSRARTAVVAWLRAARLAVLVLATRLLAAARRQGPRLRRGADQLGRNARGAAVALVLAAVLVAVPVTRAALASPRWAEVAEGIGERLGACGVLLAATAALALAWLLGPASVLGWLLAVPALVIWAVRVGRAVYPHTVRGRVRIRYGRDGWAGFWELHRHVSAHAVRHTAVRVRPSLGELLPARIVERGDVAAAGGVGVAAGATARRSWLIERMPVTETGTWVGRSAVGTVWGTQCYVAHTDVLGLIAPPQTGKTALLMHQIIDHTGAVVSTSTKPDIYLTTAALRSLVAASRRVELFNPEDLGGLTSTFRWSPVRGCADPATADERAGHLVGATAARGDTGDGDRWDEWATGVLRCLLMAADLDGRSMADVARWVFDPVGERGAPEALGLLERTHHDRVPAGVVDALRSVLTSDARKTRGAIFLTLQNAVGFMTNPTVAAVCTPADGEPVFDVAGFLADRGTLYVLGSDRERGSVAPLLAALTGYIFETAKRHAADQRGERLDPPLLLALDEAALISPVPLDRWVADAGGRGIHIVWAVQSPSQLAQRWGRDGANTIWNATNAKLIYGGLTLEADLEAISRLCGTRLETVADASGSRFERVPVCPPDRVRTIPQWHALLLHRATPATIVRMFPAWERTDVIRAGRPARVPPIDDPAAGLVPDPDATAQTGPAQAAARRLVALVPRRARASSAASGTGGVGAGSYRVGDQPAHDDQRGGEDGPTEAR